MIRLRAASVLFVLVLGACHQGAGPRPGGYRIYVTNEGSGDLTVLDQSGRRLASIPLGKRPRGVVAAADGKTVFVALTGSPAAPPGADERKLPPADRSADGVGVVDAVSLKLTRVIRGIVDPEQLALSKDGILYAGSEEAGAVLVLDAQTGRSIGSIPVGEAPEGVALSPDGRFLYVTLEDDNQLVVVDAALRRVIKRLGVGGRPRSIAFSPDGTRAYVTDELGAAVTILDARTHAVVGTIAVAGKDARPMGVVVSPDGRRVYVSTGRGRLLAELDPAAGKTTATTEVGQRPWGVALSPDGRRIYTANGPSGDVSVVGASSLNLIRRIPAGAKPWGVAVAPAP